NSSRILRRVLVYGNLALGSMKLRPEASFHGPLHLNGAKIALSCCGCLLSRLESDAGQERNNANQRNPEQNGVSFSEWPLVRTRLPAWIGLLWPRRGL